jgi:hypothetical protein
VVKKHLPKVLVPAELDNYYLKWSLQDYKKGRGVKNVVVCMGKAKTKEDKRGEVGRGVLTSQYKCCKTSFVSNPQCSILLKNKLTKDSA